MNLLEKFKAFILSNKEEILQEFEAEQKALSESLKAKTADKKEIKTLTIGNFTKAEQKSAQGNYLVIRGIASNNQVDRTGDVIIPSGVKVISGFNGRIPMLFSHDHEKVVGHWYSYGPSEDKYVVEGRVFQNYNPEVYELVKNGDLQALSVGFYVLDWEKDIQNPDITIFKEIDLFEVSLVAVGAHQGAHITDVVESKKSKAVDAVVKNESDNNEGEDALPPVEAEVIEVEPAKEDKVEVIPEISALESKVQELQTQLDNALKENARIGELEAELSEVGELLSESEEIIETLKEEKRIKYGLKN